jgi:hypothetical protein
MVNLPPQTEMANSAEIEQMRQQLTVLQNVLVSLNGVEGNSRLANLIRQSIGDIGDSALEENNSRLFLAGRRQPSRRNNSNINGLMKYARRQVVSQLSSAIRRSLARDF